MEIEAPSIGAPTISAPAIETPIFSGPEFPPAAGGLDSLGGRTSSLIDSQLAFDFGSEHQISAEIFSADKVVSHPENVFNESFFEIAIRPQASPEKPNLAEIFGSEMDSMEPAVFEGPVSQPERVFDESFFEAVVRVDRPHSTPGAESAQTSDLQSASAQPAIGENLLLVEEPPSLAMEESLVQTVSDLDEDKAKLKEELEKKTQLIKERVPLEPKTVWQILIGELEQPQTTLLGKIDVEEQTVQEETSTEETVVATQPAVLSEMESGGKGRIKIGASEDQSEDAEEPKEPLWEISRKKEGKEEIAKQVLERRTRVAQEVVEESAKEMAEERDTSGYWLTSKVVARLGKLDIPSFTEAVRIIIGRLSFPLVAGRAQKEITSLKPGELIPEGILKSLHKTLVENPPLKPKVDKMENEGHLPQSKLEKVSEEAAVLAQEGASHIIYEPQAGRWVKVDRKPSRYPFELDKTKKTVSAGTPEVIDREKSLWYTLFAERAWARAKQRKTKS